MVEKTYDRIMDGFLQMCVEDKELLERRRQLMIMEEDE